MVPLSELQNAAEPSIASVFAGAGLTPERTTLLLEAPFYNPGAPEPVVRYAATGVVVDLFENDATFEAGNQSARFELSDYASREEFLVAFITSLRQALGVAAV